MWIKIALGKKGGGGGRRNHIYNIRSGAEWIEMNANNGLCFLFFLPGITIIQSNRNQRWLSPVQRGKPPSGFNFFIWADNKSQLCGGRHSDGHVPNVIPFICNEEMGRNKIIEGLFGVECLWSIEKVKSVCSIVRSAQCLHVRGRIKTQQLNMTENKG